MSFTNSLASAFLILNILLACTIIYLRAGKVRQNLRTLANFNPAEKLVLFLDDFMEFGTLLFTIALYLCIVFFNDMARTLAHNLFRPAVFLLLLRLYVAQKRSQR